MNIASLYKLRDARIKAEVINQVLRPMKLETEKLAGVDKAIDEAITTANAEWTKSSLGRFLEPHAVDEFLTVIERKEFKESSE